MYLLIEYREGYVQPPRPGHITCSTVQDDYYNPIILTDTKGELIAWIRQTWPSADINVNGDTVVVKRKAWNGNIKGVDTYYMVTVEKGKCIGY
jgi:hypothetical protein